MANTARQEILAQIKTILEDVDDVNYVEIDRATPVDLDTVSLPAVFVYTSREVRCYDERAVIGYETWDWELVIEVWTQETDQEELLGKIHSAMFADNDLGDHAILNVRTGVSFYVLDVTKSIKSMVLTYYILYRHTLGVM